MLYDGICIYAKYGTLHGAACTQKWVSAYYYKCDLFSEPIFTSLSSRMLPLFFVKIVIWLTNMIMHDNALWCPDFKNKKMTIFSWLPLLQLYRYTLVLHCFNHQAYRWPEIDLWLRSTLYLTGVAFQCHTAANCSLASNELRWIERLRPNKSDQTNKSTQKWWNI